ncbi:MAG: hypothetical protein HY774_22635 [Acidobacteria bacterium]|nr:hypothetical protein [Acidobacteriota bacterium]
MSENLFPRETYDLDESGYWKQAQILSGVLFGTGMWVAGAGALLFVFKGFGNIPNAEAVLFVGTLLGVLSGIFFGLTWGWIMRQKVKKFMDRLYSRDPALVDLPEHDEQFRYRLPGSYIPTPNFAVGGICYFGDSGLLFIPHKGNLPRDMNRISWSHTSIHQIQLVEQDYTLLKRLLMNKLPFLIEVTTESGKARFFLPCPETTIGILKKEISRNQIV